MKIRTSIIGLVFLVVACNSRQDQTKNNDMLEPDIALFEIQEKKFGFLNDSIPVTQFIVKEKSGFEMRILDYGCIMTHLIVPDRNGLLEDIVLGFDDLASYVSDSPYFGSIVGRYGNRIAHGKFSIDNTSYTLAKNNGANHLHGGIKGFDKRMWLAKPFVEKTKAGVEFSYTSADGEEGYPGNLSVKFLCYLTDKYELVFEFEATTDQKTVCNLTQHNYYNLSGNSKSDILDHHLKIHANQITPVDNGLIPTGQFMEVEGNAFDFRSFKSIGKDINSDEPQLKAGGGYDHNFVLKDQSESLHECASVIDHESGRRMDIFTSEPGVQFYSGNFLDGSFTDKHGVLIKKHFALCLETQHFPDSPNQPNFPSVLLEPGEVYKSSTVQKFYTVDAK